MLNKWALSAGLSVAMIGQVYAGQITCPAVADIQRNIEALEDVFLSMNRVTSTGKAKAW